MCPDEGATTIYVPDTWTDSPHLAGQPPITGIPMCGGSGGGSSGSAGGGSTNGTYISRTWQLRFCIDAGVAGCDPASSAANQAPSIPAGTAVTMVCWQDGPNATGDYTTNRWFWVRAANDLQGFVSASVVRNQTGVGNCSGNVNVRVASEAAKLSGQTYAASDVAQLFSSAEWGTPYGEWAGDCPKLPYTAWFKATGRRDILKYNAIQNYRAYNSRGMIKGGTPSVGAIVYFDITSYGHTATYLGAGMIATTTNLDGARTPNAIRPMSAYANYLGWTMP